MIIRRKILAGICVLAAVLALDTAALPALAASPELDQAASATLGRLTGAEPGAAALLPQAKGVLIFPEIVKGGALLRVGGKTTGTFRSSAVSFGLQLGVSKFGYVMFLMDQDALDYVRSTEGWEVGVGPNITVVDKGVAGKLTTTSAQSGVYVFFVDQKGLFAGAGIEGTKISRVGD